MKVLINDSQNRFKGPKGDKGEKGDKGDSGTYSLEQIFSSGLSPEVTAKFINTIANDPQKRFRGDIGPTGPTGPSGSIANVSELATQILGDDKFKTGISGGIVKTTDFDNLSNNFNSFKTDVTNNYLKSGTADSTWWNTQLQANFGLYNKPEIKNDSTKSSPYVWNNFYTKGESDSKFALQTSLNNYYNKTESDGKFAKISQLPNMNNINPSSFSVNGTKTIADSGGVQQTPNLSIFSNEQTGKDFVIQNVTSSIGGGDISINPRFYGNVIIGYDKYGLNPSTGYQKDTNIPNTRLAVKGDISASNNLIGKGLEVNSFENVKAGDKLLSTYIQEKSPTPNLSEYAKNTSLNNYYNKTDSDGKFALQTSLNTELQKYSKLNNDATFNNITSNGYISTDQYLQTKGGINIGGISSIFSGNEDNVINIRPDITDKTVKNAVNITKGGININDGSKGLKIGNWNIAEDGNKLCFNNSSSGLNIKRCFGDETILTFTKNQSNRTINFNTNWKLNEESEIISFDNSSGSQGDANLNVNIWLNFSNYTFNKIELKIQSHLGKVTVIQTPAPNSTENIKTLTTSKNYGSEELLPLTYDISQLNPVSKVICIQVSKSNDYYWFKLFKVTLS